MRPTPDASSVTHTADALATPTATVEGSPPLRALAAAASLALVLFAAFPFFAGPGGLRVLDGMGFDALPAVLFWSGLFGGVVAGLTVAQLRSVVGRDPLDAASMTVALAAGALAAFVLVLYSLVAVAG